MAKARGFIFSDEIYYKLYQQGIDALYYKNIPVLRFYKHTIYNTKSKPQRSSKQILLQNYFKFYSMMYKHLSPLTKALLKAEARQYNMTAKDLYFYYCLRAAAEEYGTTPLFCDLYFYNENDSITLDFITSEFNNYYLTIHTTQPQQSAKFRRYRGTVEKCPVPPDRYYKPAYLLPLPFKGTTYLIRFYIYQRVQALPRTKTYYYNYYADEVFALVEDELNAKWQNFTMPASDFAFYSDIIIADSGLKSLNASGTNRYTLGYYDFTTYPDWQKFKKIYFDLRDVNYEAKQLSNEPLPFQDYFDFLFDKYNIRVPRGLKFFSFPRVPAGMVIKPQIYCLFRSNITFSDIRGLLKCPDPSQRSELWCIMQSFPKLYALKGRYFLFRFNLDIKDMKYYHVVVSSTQEPNTYRRITPIFRPSAVRRWLKRTPVPDPSWYDDLSEIIEEYNTIAHIPGAAKNSQDYKQDYANVIDPCRDLKPSGKSPLAKFNEYRNNLQNPSWTDKELYEVYIDALKE